jgi:hypothetical protein
MHNFFNVIIFTFFIAFSALGSTHDSSWTQALRKAIESKSAPQKIDRSELSDCSSISVITNPSGKALARKALGGLEEFAYKIAEELGLADHLAPKVSINGVRYEKFIRLFETDADEQTMASDSLALELRSLCGKYGDLSVCRLANHYKETVGETQGIVATNRVLNLVDPASMDELFLHHIITSASDSAGRNFLLQYRQDKLQLVRIDYRDSIFGDDTKEFEGENLGALSSHFTAKGREIIDRLSELRPNADLWKAEVRKNPIQAKKWKFAYSERVRALKFMNEANFFERHTRAETMLALYYLGVRDQLDQRMGYQATSFVDNYWASGHYNLADNQGNNLTYVSMFVQWACSKNESGLIIRKSFREDLMNGAIDEFMHAQNIMELPGFKELLSVAKKRNARSFKANLVDVGLDTSMIPDVDYSYDPFSASHLTSVTDTTTIEVRRREAKSMVFDKYAKIPPLNSDLWTDVAGEIQRYLPEDAQEQDFISLALSAVVNQKPIKANDRNDFPCRTKEEAKDINELQQSFMQQGLAKKTEAVELWKTFLQTCNTFSNPKAGREAISLPVRVLEIASLFEEEQRNSFGSSSSFVNSKEIEDMQTLQLNVLATGGTFGMNFSRTANYAEADLMIKSLQSLGRSLRAGAIDALFVDYSSSLTSLEAFKLKNHQLNCATVVLHAAFESEGFEDVFSAIDGLLLVKGFARGSKQRYSDVMKMSGRSIVVDETEEVL